MAKHYGVCSRYNVSRSKSATPASANKQEARRQVEFIEDDWRNITGKCDAFVSIGMLEHVGPENCQRLSDVIHNSLEPHGRGLIHTIGMNYNQRFNRWIEDRIFPGAQPPSLRQMLDVFEPHDFSVIDVENLRPHYARHSGAGWAFERLPVREMCDEQFIRMWRMYLGASASAFETGGCSSFRWCSAGVTSHFPWTEHLYRTAQRAPRSENGWAIRQPRLRLRFRRFVVVDREDVSAASSSIHRIFSLATDWISWSALDDTIDLVADDLSNSSSALLEFGEFGVIEASSSIDCETSAGFLALDR
jgi:cyclopropane-fatty-acyl-phospholipid synthase